MNDFQPQQPESTSPGLSEQEPSVDPPDWTHARSVDTAVADGQFHHVDPRSVPLERIGGWISIAVISGGGLIALAIMLLAGANTLSLTITGGAWLLVSSLLLWSTLVYPRKFFERLRYRVDEDGIEIHKGVWWRRIINVARTRIQHTDVSQGPLARQYGIAKLVIHTAGTENASVELPGLARETAMALRDHLVARGEADDGV